MQWFYKAATRFCDKVFPEIRLLDIFVPMVCRFLEYYIVKELENLLHFEVRIACLVLIPDLKTELFPVCFCKYRTRE